ncbi:MAG: N-acetyltransferase [Bacteroidota bacterium]
MIYYRSETPEDLSAIAALHARSWQQNYRGIWPDHYLDHEVQQERFDVWQKRFMAPKNNQYLCLAVDESNQLAGFICLFAEDDFTWGSLIDNLHVDPAFKRQGIGGKLIKKARNHLQEKGFKAAHYLWVLRENAAACAFYERIGGKVVEERLMGSPAGGEFPVLRYAWKS